MKGRPVDRGEISHVETVIGDATSSPLDFHDSLDNLRSIIRRFEGAFVRISFSGLLIIAAVVGYGYYKLHTWQAASVILDNRPAEQAAFVQVNEDAQAKYKNRANDLSISPLRRTRDGSICGMHLTNAVNWVGTIHDISPSDDQILMAVDIADGIYLESFGNAARDKGIGTQIPKDSPVYRSLLALKEGQRVRFSGQFVANDSDCPLENSVTDDGSLREPEYIFKLSQIAPIETSESVLASSPPPAVLIKATPTCYLDWRACRDNADIANNYSKIVDAQAACKIKANELAKYGTPEWPWLVFSSYQSGADGPTTGTLHLVEQNAKFQNGFGAMTHVVINCAYDLATKSVVDVSMDQP